MDTPLTFSEELRRYMSLLRQWAWLLALAAILGGGGAYIASKRMAPIYRASTLVLINETPGTKTADYSAVMTNERLARTYAEVMTTRPVLEGAIRSLDLHGEAETVREAIQVEPLRDTQLILIEVENTDPTLAARLANALVDEFSRQNQDEQARRFAASKQNLEVQLALTDQDIRATSNLLSGAGGSAGGQAERDRLEAALAQHRQTYAALLQSYEQVRLDEAQSTATVVQKEPAVPPTKPVRPKALTNSVLAAIVGMMAAVGIILLLDALDDTVRDPAEITRELGLPVLGMILNYPMDGGLPVTAARPRSSEAEAFRSLRSNLQFASVHHPLRTLLVTSPAPGDGKSTVAANLAAVLAQGERQVALIDADLRRPSQHRLFHLDSRPGLSDLFLLPQREAAAAALEHSLQPCAVPGLRLLPGGSPPPNPAELLASVSMALILETTADLADLAVLDSPPVLAVTDACVLAPLVDGVLLAVKPGKTKLAACRQATEQLQRAGANLLGVALNDVRINRLRYPYYQYSDCYSRSSRAGEELPLRSRGNGRRTRGKAREAGGSASG